MHKRIITTAALVAGFLIGAAAISALADTTSWTPPTAPPPGGNVDAPINVGSVTQQKNGWLGVNGLVTANLTVASGTPGVGSILVSDANGNASWQPSVTTDSCILIGQTSLTNTHVIVPVPSICINNTCGLFLAVINGSGAVDSISTADLIEVANSAKSSKGAVAYWWGKPGGGNDHSDCSAGRNGTSEGCDTILGAARDNIALHDDYTGTEVDSSDWTLVDTNDSYSTQLYACQ